MPKAEASRSSSLAYHDPEPRCCASCSTRTPDSPSPRNRTSSSRCWPGDSGFVTGRGRPLREFSRHPRFELWALDPASVRSAVLAGNPIEFSDVVRGVFSAYARSQGKARWGDKTPDYVLHIGKLARLFPDARFVHLVRDGREVAAACADYGWVPSSVSGAYWWRVRVAKATRAGRRLGADRYLMVQLEQLVADPEAVLSRICGFLGERYEPSMLDYPATAESRHPRQAFRREHSNLTRPPTAGLRDWRAGLSPRSQRLVEVGCGRWLGRFGYPVVWSPTIRSRPQAFLIRLREWPSSRSRTGPEGGCTRRRGGLPERPCRRVGSTGPSSTIRASFPSGRPAAAESEDAAMSGLDRRRRTHPRDTQAARDCRAATAPGLKRART